ncbi:MAG: HEAT repeat domain-containing protein, partial [Planctomycetes bacterium]|nr:HEAT repeat domain-containing protein [Planctomycetota bacterium]
MSKSGTERGAAAEPVRLEAVYLDLPYVPDFLLEDTVFWLAPNRSDPRSAYHEVTGESARRTEAAYTQAYYTKKGWGFIHAEPRAAEGPFRVPLKGLHLKILEPGRIFAPRPALRLKEDGPAIPIVSLEKRKPLNPWKPSYIQALNFIKRYEWPHELPRSVHHAVWEIEECGQIAGSTSWRNAEIILRDLDSRELRLTLADLFYNRPEDYPLGSEVYLRALGRSADGFAELLELAKHPVARKRKVVAATLGGLKDPQGTKTLLELLEDEDPDVRNAALRAVGRAGLRPGDDPEGKVAAYVGSDEVKKRVWAAQALLKAGQSEYEKYLIGLVKEEPRLLTDMGELGDVLADLGLHEAVPYLIQRLKHAKSEYRADAAEALARLTGHELGYHNLDTEDQCRNAIKTYDRWWEERKRERRKSRAGIHASKSAKDESPRGAPESMVDLAVGVASGGEPVVVVVGEGIYKGDEAKRWLQAKQADVHNERGIKHFEAGEHDKAIEEYRKA